MCFRDMGLAPPLRGSSSNNTIYLQVQSVKASKVAQRKKENSYKRAWEQDGGEGFWQHHFCEVVYLFVCACGNQAGQVIMNSMSAFTSSLLPGSERDRI